jgi:hypothetical protein
VEKLWLEFFTKEYSSRDLEEMSSSGVVTVAREVQSGEFLPIQNVYAACAGGQPGTAVATPGGLAVMGGVIYTYGLP